MPQQRYARWFGELFVIVVGVLVALAVDDVMQSRTDRELEAHLLERLTDDLVADEADLAFARVQVSRRQWFFDTMVRTLAEGGVVPPPPDSLVNMQREAALLEAAGRAEQNLARNWRNPRGQALAVLEGYPQFDLSDGSYQEMLATGALRTLKDRSLRSSILAYYRTAEDFGGNVTEYERYRPQLTEELISVGIAVTDSLTLDEVADLLRRSPSLAARVRDAQSQLFGQAINLRRIDEARATLEGALARRAGR